MERKKSYRIISSVLLFAMLVTSMPIVVFASNDSTDIKKINQNIATYENETSDENEVLLLEKQTSNDKPDEYGEIKNKSGKSISVPVYKLRNEVIYTDADEILVAQTYGYELTGEQLYEVNTNLSDPYGSLVTGFITIYYNKKIDSYGVTSTKLTKITGYYTRNDLAFSVTGQKVHYAEIGCTSSGVVNVENVVSVSSSSWSVSTGITDYLLAGTQLNFGADYILTITRASSSWTFTIPNWL